MSQLLTQVTNTVTAAVTTFNDYPFNSMTKFRGAYLGASDAGLTLLDDATSVEPIVGTMGTGLLDFGTVQQKRCSDFYLSMRSLGDVTLRVATDEGAKFEYVIKPLDISTIKTRRSPIGKGLKGTYWYFELECSDEFDFDAMNIAAVPVSRRL